MTKELGNTYIPLYVRIVGSERPPFEVSISACAIGPIIEVETDKIDWGKVDVLKSHAKQIKIRNKSPIPGPLSVTFTNKNTLFSCPVQKSSVPPGSDIDLTVLVTPDEAVKFTEEMIITIENGDRIPIELTATGIGSSITASIPLEKMDFKDVFTSIPSEIRFTLINKGRRTQTVNWVSLRKKSEGDGVFKVSPDRIALPPKTEQEFVVTAFSAKEGKFTEILGCRTSGKSQKQICETTIEATFTAPLAKFSTNKLNFDYIYSNTNPPDLQRQELTVTNVSPLPLSLSMKPSIFSLFAIDPSECVINKGESIPLRVYCNPDYKQDRLSSNVKTKLTISYKDHPQKDSIDLTVSINFPNVDIPTTPIDFGTVMNDSQKKKQIVMTNNGIVDADYAWRLHMLEEEKTEFHIANVFDLLPIKGTIKAGEKVNIDVLFNSQSNGSFRCSAICFIQGGPMYEVSLKGESSFVKYSVDTQHFDFGLVPYFAVEEKELIISNTGRVLFSYMFDTSTLTLASRIEVVPASGRLKAGEKQKVIVKFFPAVPEQIEEHFFLAIADFEPIKMTAKAISVFPTVTTSLDLVDYSLYNQFLQEVHKNKEAAKVFHDMSIATLKRTGEIPDVPQPQNSESLPEDIDLVREAYRLFFRDHLIRNPIMKPSGKRTTRQENRSGSRASMLSRYTLSKFIETQVVLQRYTCAFGNIIKGMSKKKVFKLSNIGLIPANVKFDKKELSKIGLNIEPIELRRLPGFPDYQSQDLTITLLSKNKKVELGEYSEVISMEVVNGYNIEFELKANIVTPDVEVSSAALDFGSLYIGYCKVITIQLYNQKEIACEWYIEDRNRLGVSQQLISPQSTMTQQQQLSNEQSFSVKQTRGILQPGERANIEVAFTPMERKKYSTSMLVKCVHNTKFKKITCTGLGKELELKIEPSELELGPVLPYSDVDVPVTITNDSDFALEVYSLDFDAKYLEEEEMLMVAPGYENGFLLIPPRNPGEPLPNFIIEAYQNSLKEKVEDEKSSPEIADNSDNIAMSEEVQIPPEKRKCLVVYGPPLSGRSTFAKEISKILNIPVLTIDEILQSSITEAPVDSEERNDNADQISINPTNPFYDAFVLRLQASDCKYGFVLDSLDSKEIADEQILAESILKACHPSTVLLVCLTLKEPTLQLRALNLKIQQSELDLEKSAIPAMSEDDFDRLSETQKEDMEHGFRAIRMKKKVLSNLYDEKSILEQEEHVTQQDIISNMKAKIEDDKKWKLAMEDDKKKKKKPKKPSAPSSPDLSPPPTFEQMNKIYEDDDEMTKNLKKYRGFFFNIVSLFDRGHKTEQDLEMERETDKKKRGSKVKLHEDTESVVAVPKSVVVDSNQLVDQMIKAVSDQFPYIFELDGSSDEVKVLEIPEPFILQRIEMPVPRKQQSVDLFRIVQQISETERRESSRWIISEKSQLQLFVRFCSKQIGAFESTLQLGITGRKLNFKIKCKGVCNYPEISTFYRGIFTRRVKQRSENRVVSRRYVVNERVFDFGPLLIRESYKDFKNSTNNKSYSENFHFTNNGLFDTKLTFSLKNPQTANCFELEPQTIVLQRDQSVDLKIWVMPKTVGKIQNTLVCLIKDNPTPYIFDMHVTGAEPKVEINKQNIDFGRLLLSSNTASEIVTIKNISLIPVKWRIIDADKSATEEFAIEPRDKRLDVGESIDVVVKFTPRVACVMKYNVIIEITDEDEIKKPEQIKFSITAESFNLEAKIESELNFGVIRAVDPASKTLHLSNSGKYDINFQFEIPRPLARFFTITPQKGVLETKSKNPTQVTVLFKTTQEKKLKSCTDIVCVLTDSKTLEKLGVTKLNINLEAVFSKYSIVPYHGINFGPLNFDKEKTKQLELKNDGPFPFTYNLFVFQENEEPPPPPQSNQRPNSQSLKRANVSAKNTKKLKDKKKELQIGRFIVEPATGDIPPGAREKINVTFAGGEGSEIYREILGIEITGRDTSEHPKGIQFNLQGESCMPGITTSDFDSIFEEQQLVASLSLLSGNLFSAFCVDERVFSFGTIAAGKKVAEKVKIINPFKVPCNVDCSIKPRDATSDPSNVAAFDVQPQKVFVPAHEHRYVTLYFEPSSLQTYSAMFEASVPEGQDTKTNNLRFELKGDGSLPQVVVKQPEAGENGIVLKFPRTMVGKTTELPITIQNEGTLSATVRFDLKMHSSLLFRERSREIVLNSKESQKFTMMFEPKRPEKVETVMNMVVLDNHFEGTVFKIIAEGFEEDITFSDLPEVDTINFGHCHVGVKKQVTFTMLNHSQNHIKYNWTSLNSITIYPAFGHLHSKASTEITVTLLANEPLEYVNQMLQCELQRIKYEEEPIEWDQRFKTVKWIQYDEEEERRKREEEERKKQEELDKKKKKNTRPSSNKKKSRQNEEAASTPPPVAPTEKKLVTKRVEIVNPEPQVEVIQGLPSKQVSLSLLSDYAQFECSAPSEVGFKLTKMFESRIFTFSMKNTGKVNLEYKWNGVEEPFEIVPATGTLAPQTDETFTIKYAPTDVGDHLVSVVCSIPNTQQRLPVVSVSGSSVCPIVHFELAPSDYLSSGRRITDSKGPGGSFGALDKNVTRVIEITSCGIRIRNTKRFYILNPTDLSYSYEWVRLLADNEEPDDGVFNCVNKRGVVHSGMKAEMVFEFIPTSLQVMESFWLFSIPSRKISVPFLLVGFATEPDLYLDTPRINFQQVLVGKPSIKTIKLINKEKIPFSFAFEQSSFGAKDETDNTEYAVLSISPSHGTIAGMEEIPITVTFVPTSEHNYNFTLSCSVRKKPTLLTCNVKGEGFKVHERLELETIGGKTILAPQLPNTLDFERAQINETKVKRIIIFNDGNYNFDFFWSHSRNPYIAIYPESGTVEKRGRCVCDVTFTPTTQTKVEKYKAVCKITNGQSYVCYIDALGTKPNLLFNWTQHNFGLCSLFNQGTQPATAVLEVKNQDDKEISYDMLYDPKPHLEVEASATVLRPKESKKILLSFKPTEVKQYKEIITFEVNGLYKIPVTVLGEGTPIRIDLWNPADKLVNFGPLQVGDTVETSISLVNKSKIPVEINFPKEMHAEMQKNFVSANCKKPVVLQPKGVHSVTVYFKPEARLSTFTNDLVVQYAGRSKTIASITGACQGIEVKLNTPVMTFGPLVKGTQVTQKLVLENSGDIGVKFNWNADKLSKEFTLYPLKGFVPANGEVSIEITYAPKADSKFGHNEKIQCLIEGHQPLTLNLISTCKDKSTEEDQKLVFKVPVRQIQKKIVKITNPTKSDWRLRPEIDNPAFSGAEYLDIPPGQTKDYEITYAPVGMTANNDTSSPDVGTLFFPRPDGEAYSFTLFGESLEPASAGDLNLDIFAKEQHIQILTVENWLSRAQRFKVQMDLGVKSPDILKAVDYIDVPPFSKREYKFTLFAYKEGVIQGRVLFRNEQTKEFQYYSITFNVKPPKYVQVLNFEATIRQRAIQTITIENPLATETRLAVKCDSRDVIVPTEIVIPATSVGKCDVQFFPLVIGDKTIDEKDLIFINNELGSFPFRLIMKSMPTGTEKNIHFNVGLGSSMTQTIRFANYSPIPTEYTCKLEGTNFIINDKNVLKVQAGGSEGKEEVIDISYEPSALGDCTDKLVLNSKTGGEYVFLLFGHCSPPKPQGPLEIVMNGSAAITFKNVINKKVDYKFSVDHEAFTVKPESASMGPKQKLQITVSFKPAASNSNQKPNPNQRIYGKLTVASKEKDKAQNASKTQWIYYLLGKMASK